MLVFTIFVLNNIRVKKNIGGTKTMERKERNNNERRSITLESFFGLLNLFNSSFIASVKQFSFSKPDKLLDNLQVSRNLISCMEECAGTQLLSDDELEIYEKTYSIVYDLYDKIEKEIKQIIYHQEQLNYLIKQLEEQLKRD
jgi:hypothetical protein